MRNDVNRLCLTCMQYTLDDSGRCGVCGAVDAGAKSPHHLPQRTVLGGKYLVAKVLGEGGFGITYLGWDINLEVKVAIKEYYPYGAVTRDTTLTDTVTALTGGAESFFAKGRDRFEDEARKLARFHTLPGIVSVRDYFLENGTAYIVMEFVEGVTLKDHLEQVGGKLSEEEALRLFQPLIQSLAQVHTVGIIHRDISPDNLMLTPTGQLRLLDFGAARDFSDLEKSLSVLLKPGYAPEEQYRSRGRQGPWTDIYALSATIFRTIEGTKPPESMERLLEDEFAGFTVAVSGNTNAVLMKGLEIRQENRWQNLDDMYAALYGVPVEGYTLPTAAPAVAKGAENRPPEPSPALAGAAAQAAQPSPVAQRGQPGGQGAAVKTATRPNRIPLFIGIAAAVVVVIVLAVVLVGGGGSGGTGGAGEADYVLYPDIEDPTADQMELAATVIEETLAAKGHEGATVAVSGHELHVSVPGGMMREAFSAALPRGDVSFVAAGGTFSLPGSIVESAEAKFDIGTSEHYVQLNLTEEGAGQMYAAMEAALEAENPATIYIYANGELVTAPTFSAPIEGTTHIVSGGFTEESAADLAAVFGEARLPFALLWEDGTPAATDMLPVGAPTATGGEQSLIYTSNADASVGAGEMESEPGLALVTLVRYGEGARHTEAEARALIEKAQEEALEGPSGTPDLDFNLVQVKYSEDLGAAANLGGQLYARGMVIDEFFDAADALGEYDMSGVVQLTEISAFALIYRLPYDGLMVMEAYFPEGADLDGRTAEEAATEMMETFEESARDAADADERGTLFAYSAYAAGAQLRTRAVWEGLWGRKYQELAAGAGENELAGLVKVEGGTCVVYRLADVTMGGSIDTGEAAPEGGDNADANVGAGEGQMRAQYIAFQYTDSESQERARARADEAMAQLGSAATGDVEGAKVFYEIAHKYSDDTEVLEGEPNGLLFGPGQMVTEFEEAVVNLDEYEISGIVDLTERGYYYIIMRLPVDFDGIG